MKFSEFEYKRPNYDDYKAKMSASLSEFKSAKSAAEQIECIDAINRLRNTIATQSTLASIRHSINNNDEFYTAESDYWDEYSPLYEKEENALAKEILSSKYLDALKAHYPAQFFTLLEKTLKSFDERIIEDLQTENKLVTKYERIKATAQIEFEGKTYTLPGMDKLLQSADRTLRERAYKAKIAYYEAHEAEIDEIFDQLVKVRDKMAKKLGYKNFVALGYNRLAKYREKILKNVTPIATSLAEKQRARLGLDKLRYYDAAYKFKSGMPAPKGDVKSIIAEGRRMYSELSAETAEFFAFMADNELMDLLSKDGKEGGGYCTFMSDFASPFIFSNFNGTAGDIEVLTHEAGHAFQIYSSRGITIPECQWPTYEACEIHSMSMEFFTYPWMKNFFKEDTDKYFFNHLSGTLIFLPYGVLVDHFQHEVYEHPEMTPAERKATWRKLEKTYQPSKDYEGCDFLERGGWWFQQGHIFADPFYYIDYTLAQVCALQFYAKLSADYKSAWADYLHLCTLGGTKSFLGLVKEARLENPFADGTVERTISAVLPHLAEFERGNIA